MVDVIDRGEVATRTNTIRRAIRRKESRIKKLQQDLAEAEIRGDHEEVVRFQSELEKAKERLAYHQNRLEQVFGSAVGRGSR